MEEIIREGKWKCPNCQQVNRGREVKCPSCGQARTDVDFIYDESAPAVEDQATLAQATGGPDWVCGYCSTSNVAGAEKCKQCGAVKGEGKARQVKDVRLGQGSQPPSDAPAAPAAPVAPASAPAQPLSAGVKVFLALLLGGFLLLFALAAWKSEKTMTLTASSWERRIEIEKLVPVVEEGWAVPQGGKVLATTRKLHSHTQVETGKKLVQETYTDRVKTGTKKVKVGVKDMGNGFFKDLVEERPVYKQVTRTRSVMRPVYVQVPNFREWYRYEVGRWKHDREVKSAGQDTKAEWPQLSLTATEREKTRHAKYEVKLAGDGDKIITYVPKEELFVQLKPGNKYQVQVNGLGQVVGIKVP